VPRDMPRNAVRAFAAALLLWSGSVLAQQADTIPRTPLDSLIQRARKLGEAGNAADARRLLDSALKIAPPEGSAHTEALYWRAALAAAAVDAERDYRRLLVEAPLSARAENAMLQLAQLEQARGDRRAATEHLQRFVLSYPSNPARPRASVTLVRLLFEQGQTARGCDALRAGKEAIGNDNLELSNQLEFYAPRCVVLESAPPAPSVDSAPPKDSVATAVAPPSAPPRATPRPPAATTSRAKSDAAFYSVQVAAYDSPEPAGRMARMLKSRGHEARVDGKTRPFRVRVGKFDTRAEAVKAAAGLKSQGIGGFVTLVKGER